MFDSLAVSAICGELRRLCPGRVQRIVQTDSLSIGLEVYAASDRHWLAATAHPDRAGIWIASSRLGQDQETISPLLLLARKYLRGAILREVSQPPYERVLNLHFEHIDHDDEPDDSEVSDTGPRRLSLIVEATGRLGNIILVDDAGVVLDAIKRVPPTINRRRTILPRRPYVGPPPMTKLAPDAVSAASLEQVLAGSSEPAANGLVALMRGVSPLAARELTYRATGRVDATGDALDPARLESEIRRLFEPVWSEDGATWEPSVGTDDGTPVAFAPYRLTHLPELEACQTTSSAVERVFGAVAGRSPVMQARAQLIAEIMSVRERELRRLESLEREATSSGAAAALREQGEMLLAYAAQVPAGANRADVGGYSIELDPTLTAIENAQHYFEQYTRARDAARQLPAMIESARARLAYIDGALVDAELAKDPDAVAALRRGIGADGLLSAQTSGQGDRRRKAPNPTPRSVTLGEFVALIGRSARENDEATFRLARSSDLWLHARGIAGAHVILRTGDRAPDARTIELAAGLAAHHSAARSSGRVEVDVTERRHVRKMKDGPPGGVTYSNERTVLVRPLDPDSLARTTS